MLNRIAHALFFVCVLGQITVGTSPAIAVLLVKRPMSRRSARGLR
jgi:hypothetical protein